MLRNFAISTLALAGVVALTTPTQADVYVRAPFVKVAVPNAPFLPPGGILGPQAPGAPLPGAPLPGAPLPGAPLPPDGQVLPLPKTVPGGVEILQPMTLS